MKKKHYEMIAEAIKAQLPLKEWRHYDELMEHSTAIANTIADTLASDNPKFNRSKFLEACGIEHVHDFDNYGKCGDCGELKTEF